MKARSRPPLVSDLPGAGHALARALSTFVLVLGLVVLGGAAAQGSPSGAFGELTLGQTVQGAIAAAGDNLVFHEYIVQVPAGAGTITIQVDGMGSDIDLAINAGRQLDNLDDADYVDTTEDPNPVFSGELPAGTVLYVYVLNLLPQPANYALTVAGAASAGPAMPGMNPPGTRSGPGTPGMNAPGSNPPATPSTPGPAQSATPGSAMPSGTYGSLALGQPVQGSIAAATDNVVFHEYVFEVPAGTGPLTVQVNGMGHDIDLALHADRQLENLDDADYLDTTEDPNPVFSGELPAGTVLYVYVLNLLPQAADYSVSVSAGGATPNVPGPAPVPTPTPPDANPLSPSDPLVGTFEGDGLQVVVQGSAGTYAGELILNGQRFPFQATGGNGRLDGSFQSGGQSYAFSATLSGDVLTVVSGGATYRTVRIGAGPSSNPLGPQNDANAPVPAPAPPNNATNDPVVAEGPYGTLTQDNLYAFFEALFFAHEQVGYPVELSEQEFSQYVSLAAQAYPTLTPDEQAAIAMSRDIWTRVQANWQQAAPQDQQEFVIGMLTLWYGEQQIQQWFGTANGGGGGGAGCEDIDSCFSTYADPESYADATNAQSCWAAAGCSDYDAGSNTFTYEDYSYDYSTDY